MATDSKEAPLGGAARRRLIVYVLGLASLVAALFVQPRLNAAVERQTLSGVWAFFTVGLYAVCWLLFSIDRWLLVRRRGYPLGQAVFRVVFGLLLGLLLTPSARLDYETPAGLSRWLRHSDPAVRSLAVEAAGYRGPDPARIKALLERLQDEAPEVRHEAIGVLCAWSGQQACDKTGARSWAEARLAAGNDNE